MTYQTFCLIAVALFFCREILVSGVFDLPTLVNITSDLAGWYNVGCIKILHSRDLDFSSNTTNHQLLKALSPYTLKTCGVYNFEKYYWLAKVKQHQLNCYKSITVVMGDKRNKMNFVALTKGHDMSDSLWLIFAYSSPKDFFQGAYFPFNAEILIANRKSPELVELQEVYQTGSYQPLRFGYVGNWTRMNGLQVRKDSLYVRRSDLEGKLIRAGSTENWPMSTFRKGSWDGYFPRIWKELEPLMNLTTQYVRAIDNSTGSQEPGGSWNGLVGMILRNEIDVIVSELSINIDRSYILDFSHPLLISKYQVFFRQPGNHLQWTSVLNPFGKAVWIAIIVWILTGTIVVSLAGYYSMRYQLFTNKNNPDFTNDPFFFMLQTLCQQGTQNVPKTTAGRIIFLCCYIVSGIVIPAYSASLISSLTYKTPERPFDSLPEMLSAQTHKLIIGKNTAEFALFSKSGHPLFQEIHQKLMINLPENAQFNTTTPYLEEILCQLQKCAVFGIERIIQLKLKFNATSCKVLSFSKPISPVSLCMGLRKNSELSKLINYQLRKLFDFGIIDRIKNQLIPKSEPNSLTRWDPVEFEEVFQIFAYLSFGILLSVLVLVLETIFWRKKTSRGVSEKDWLRQKKRCDLPMDFYLE